MKILQRMILVQFFLCDAEELTIGGHAAFLGQNGSGKTSILDGIQIAMLGAHGNYLAFNTQSVGTQGGGRRNPRSIRDYCLGVIDDTGGSGSLDRKRDNATTYITLVFEDDKTGEPVSIGVCLRASAEEIKHEVLGLYVLPGLGLTLADHIEKSEGGDMPLLWSDFSTAIRGRFSAMQRTPFFTAQSTAYISEMLHALQPKAKAINPTDYLKVFNKSVLLRNIESVDTFVRDYVIEPQSIDRRKAKAQIDHFKRLQLLMQQVQRQISDLTEIRGKYEEVKKYAVRAASLRALGASYLIEESKENCSSLKNEISNLFLTRRGNQIAINNLERGTRAAWAAKENADADLASAPGMRDHTDKFRLRDQHESSYAGARQRIEPDMSRISSIFHDIVELNPVPTGRDSLKAIKQSLDLQTNLLSQGNTAGLEQPIGTAIESISVLRSAIDQAVLKADDDMQAAKEELARVTGQIKNADKGGVAIGKDVGAIISRLHDIGIDAEPVCNLVSVTKPEWQPAIETFLKDNRESLVVTPGREADAVAYLRKLPASANPYAASVIQPKHLKDIRWDDRNEKLVGNLLTSDNPLALLYLRGIFGRMLCVESEQELEDNPRSMTVDGMLSAGFTTKRMRLFAQHDLMLGIRISEAEKTALLSSMKTALAEEERTKLRHERLTKLQKEIGKLGDLADLKKRVIADVRLLNESRTRMQDLTRILENIDLGDLTPLREIKKEREDDWNKSSKLLDTAKQELGGTENQLKNSVRGLVSARKNRDLVIANKSALLLDQDVNEFVIHDYRADIDTSYQGKSRQEKADSCDTRARRAENDADPFKTEAISLLNTYLSANNISLGTVMGWREALEWSAVEIGRLNDTELHKREKEVAAAKTAAEVAFRNDIAVRMKESIEQMNATIKVMNIMLANSPPFSNGERYEFKSHVAETHKKLYEYIMEVGKTQESDMFLLGNDAHDEIMKLLDEAEGDNKDSNPLDDYRTLFNFDLAIKRDGRKDTLLSKRLGVGSNGEHRAPFYVIAGAAMAAAYRIDAGKHSTGAGVMLLDEAFYGMDQQNSLAAARFLDSIGLQIIMAAPEADHSKLAPSLDTIYELNRFGMDVYIDAVKIKPEAHRLLTSDMPSEHPDLIAQMVEKIEAGAV